MIYHTHRTIKSLSDFNITSNIGDSGLGCFMVASSQALWHRVSTRFSRLRIHPLFLLLLVGIALRLGLSPFTSYPNDIAVLYRATNDLLRGLNIYTTNSFSYPPLWPYAEYILLDLAGFLTSPKIFGVRTDTLVSLETWKLPPVITSPLFNILSKFPLLVADLLIGIIIYDFVKDLRDERRARLSFILWFFNPLVICINSMHGQIDVLPALMTVLSFCFFFKHRYIASGVAIGLGTLFKIYPVLLIPLYLFSIGRLENEKSLSTSMKVERIFTKSLKLAAGVMLSLCVFLIPLINSNIVHDVFTRTLVTSLGGLTIFNIAQAPQLPWLLPFMASHSVLVSTSLITVLAILILLIGVTSFFARKDFLETFILGHIAILLATYLTSLTVNPQYILWILPFLILSHGLYNYNLKSLTVISTSALTFLIGLRGPLFFFYPLAIFTPFLKVQQIYANEYFFEKSGGWFILLVSGIIGVIALLLCFGNTLASLLNVKKRSLTGGWSHKEGQSDTARLMHAVRWPTVSPSKVLALALTVLMIGQFLAFVQPSFQEKDSFSIVQLGSKSATSVEVQYSIRSGSYPVDIQIFATPAISGPSSAMNKTVFIYYSEDYPSSFVDRARWIGLLDHAPVELKLRGYNGSVKVVDADGLRNVMNGDSGSVIIIPSGVFPDTVHAHNETLVGNWLRSGGTLIWMGDAFGYLSGGKDGATELFSENNFSEVQDRILGVVLFNGSSEAEEYASVPSGFSGALDLQYTDALVGASVSNVLKCGGIVLGKLTQSEDARASICCVPAGTGHLILFGGGIGTAFTANGEDVIAHDIAQILCSGFPFSSGLSAFETLHLDKNEVKEATLEVPLPSQNVTGVMISAFSKSPYDGFFMSQYYPIDEK